MNGPEMTNAVQDALEHLYDVRYLRRHALASEVCTANLIETWGEELHNRLRTAIDRLCPPAGTPAHLLAWRSHRYLTLRYIHALTVHQVASELGITERHCRRIHRQAIAELVPLLSMHEAVEIPRQDDHDPSSNGELLAKELDEVGTSGDLPSTAESTVRGVIQTLDALACNAQVTISLAESFDRDLMVERMLTRQILLNLLLHVIGSQQGERVTLNAQEDRGWIRLDVVVGMTDWSAPVVLPEQTDEHLSIARHLADVRGGNLKVAQRGNERHFMVTLPPSRSRAVLLIDDNLDFLRFLRRCLADTAYSVLEATDAADGLRKAQGSQPDIVILDILIPGQDGWETLQLLKNHRLTRHIPVIVCSVLRDRDLAFSLGADEWITKPSTPHALLDILDRCYTLAHKRNVSKLWYSPVAER